MLHVMVLKGRSQYNVLHYFESALTEGFRACGCRISVVDLTSPELGAQLIRAIRRPVDFALAFNGIGTALQHGGSSAYERLGIPYLTFLVDHPLYEIGRIKDGPTDLSVTCVDPTHLDFMARRFERRLPCEFVPHGGCGSGEVAERPAARDIDLLFCGGYYGVRDHFDMWRQLPPIQRQLIEDIAAAALCVEEEPLMTTALRVMQARGISPLAPSQFNELCKILITVDQYVIGYRRLAALSALVRAGVDIHIFGNGWESSPLCDCPAAHIHPAIEFSEALQVIRRAKIMLNMVPSFPGGSHERVFTAMLNGAVVLTGSGSYLRRHFRDDEDLLSFSWLGVGDLPERVRAGLASPTRLRQMAERARAKAVVGHMWTHRAQQILAWWRGLRTGSGPVSSTASGHSERRVPT